MVPWIELGRDFGTGLEIVLQHEHLCVVHHLHVMQWVLSPYSSSDAPCAPECGVSRLSIPAEAHAGAVPTSGMALGHGRGLLHFIKHTSRSRDKPEDFNWYLF